MNFIEEAQFLLKSFYYWLMFFIIVAVFLFVCGPYTVSVQKITFSVPIFTTDNYISYVFRYIQEITLGDTDRIFSLTPLSGFTSQVSLSFLISFILTFPILLLSLFDYLWPALFKREKKFLMLFTLISILLFIGGCIFSSVYIVPKTFDFLITYTENIGSSLILDVEQFVRIFIMMTISVGLLFLIPVFMVLSSMFRLINPLFWRRNWRIIILCIAIFSAIITPDGSGITMILLTLPLGLLYVCGLLISLKIYK